MTLQQAITLLQDLIANHKESRFILQKELGNLRSEGFEVKVALNVKTSALVAEVEQLLTKLKVIEVMQQATLEQAVTQQPETLLSPTEVVIVQTDPIQSFAVEESLQAIVEATVEQTVTPSVDVRQVEDAAELETDAETGIEVAETLSQGEAPIEAETQKLDVYQMFEVMQLKTVTQTGLESVAVLSSNVLDVLEMVEVTPSVEVSFDAEAAELETIAETELEESETIQTDVTEVVESEPSTTRKTLTEIMAMPMPESTTEEERELAMLEDLFAPREQSEGDKSEVTLPETVLQNSSQLHCSAKSFELIVLVLVILILVFKAIITVIKAIEESQAATVSAKSFEQMYVAVGQKVRYRSKGFVKGFAVA